MRKPKYRYDLQIANLWTSKNATDIAEIEPLEKGSVLFLWFIVFANVCPNLPLEVEDQGLKPIV